MKIRDVARLCYKIYNTAWFGAISRVPLGFNVFEDDWDVLVMLDACRVDALQEVANEYEWLPGEDIESRWSIASNSRGWIASTFSEKFQDEIEDTVYINANGYAPEILERDRQFPSEDGYLDLANWSTVSAEDMLLHHCVRESSPDYRLDNHAPPELVLDRALSAKEKFDPERLIIHFHQPHSPFHARAVEDEDDPYDWEEDPFTALKSGSISFESVWNAYLDELRWGLESVEKLQNILDKETIAISADHGEAFGELGFYRHILGVPHPKMKQVPWIEIEGKGQFDDYEPVHSIQDSERYQSANTDEDINERLRALGYAE